MVFLLFFGGRIVIKHFITSQDWTNCQRLPAKEPDASALWNWTARLA